MKRIRLSQLIAGPAFLAMMPFLLGDILHAATITVTGTGDTIAIDGLVTLREAITASNTDAISGDAPAGSGLDTIAFNIPGLPGVVHTIQPTSALPVITDAVIIDGYSQLGAAQNSLANGSNAFLAIELDGTNAGAAPGLSISVGSSTVQGLVINRFANEGILITLAGGNTIRGNYIGTDQTGLLDRGNLGNGLTVISSNNVIGGSTPSDRNVVSGNDGHGVAILNPVTANRVAGTYIGVTNNGVTALANGGSGVYISEGNNNTIGGLLPENGNVIAFNGADGILIDADAGVGNLILGNSIHDNNLLGIDLNNDGVTLNDAMDADVGPNNLQNYAVLLTATTNEFGLVLQGSLASTPNTAHRIEFFANTAADASGYGEGQTYIGFIDVTTDAVGNATFVFQSSTSQTVGTLISSTTTDPNNNTSEFSANVAVTYRASEESDDDGDDDNIFSDDDGFGPFPFPFGGPAVPPIPPAAAPPITPAVDVATEPMTTSVGEVKKEESLVSASEVSSMENAPAIRNEEINIRPKPRKSPNAEESSGCSTLSGVDTTLFALCAMVLALVRMRLRKKA